MTTRPAGVPTDAWWSAADNEWILGTKDGAGRLQGVVRYWRPDGTLVNECAHVDGTPHGASVRFHETGEVSQTATFECGKLVGTRTFFATDGVTTEGMHANGVSKLVRKMEIDYVADRAVTFRYFDAEGRATGRDGALLPARPANVPPEAMADKSGDWVAGQWTEQSQRRGVMRRWSPTGTLVYEDDHGEGEGTVAVRTFRADDGTPRMRFSVVDKQLVGEAEAWHRDGTLRVRMRFEPVPAEPPAPAPEPLADEDSLVLDAIDGHDASVIEAGVALSPTGLAHAIAKGWGGDEDRDATAARLARRVVKQLAPASLRSRLAALGLDRAPRILTPARVFAAARALAEDAAVDGAALDAMLVEGGGTGIALALATPSRALSFLRGRIREQNLNLAHLGLTELPAALGRLPDLQRVDASHNRLATLPAEVGDVFRLMSLDLSSNQIHALPAELTRLPDLRTLHLAKNALAVVPPTTWQLDELQSLGLGDNELVELTDAIGELRSLQTLWLNGNPLRDLPRGLTRLPALTFLHLGDHEWADPPAILAELHTLEELWIASPALTRLPAELVTLPRLRRLMCWHSGLTEVPRALFEATGLKELRITSNPLPPGTIEALKEALPGCAIY